jgi:hypothetical protein
MVANSVAFEQAGYATTRLGQEAVNRGDAEPGAQLAERPVA